MYQVAGPEQHIRRQWNTATGLLGGLLSVGNLVAAVIFARWAGKGPDYVHTASGGVSELPNNHARSHLELAQLLFSLNAFALAAGFLVASIRSPQRNRLLIATHAILTVAALLLTALSLTSLYSQPLY
ncbi:hypothetical protein [Nocardia niigatensis]|uniref:hypothetical protein n=1 Tax=Nocardia niigatensis TaxID=209249 RepID=UPI0002E86716|nr:hypothetical protein [Nocardia niigatensis]HEX2972147.1 hypothetical protein [Tepidisphaeraceae bacterium]